MKQKLKFRLVEHVYRFSQHVNDLSELPKGQNVTKNNVNSKTYEEQNSRTVRSTLKC